MGDWSNEGIAAWDARGTRVPIGGNDVFYIDAPASGSCPPSRLAAGSC